MKTVDVLNAYIEEGDEEEDSLQKNQGGNLTLQVPVLQVQEVAEKDKKTARPPVAHGHGHGHSHAIPIKKDDESVGDTFDDNDAACDHGHSHDVSSLFRDHSQSTHWAFDSCAYFEPCLVFF